MSSRQAYHQDERRSRHRERDSVTRSPVESSHRHHHHHHHHGRHHDERSRSRSPHRSGERRHSHMRKRSPATKQPEALPYSAQPLSRHNFKAWRPVFALYLDVQKQRLLEDLPDDEVRGRWKSFVGRWNRGELAEGWYDPSTRQRAFESEAAAEASPSRDTARRKASPDYGTELPASRPPMDEDLSDDEDDVVGPTLPGQNDRARATGPSDPTSQDLALRREQTEEDSLAELEDLRHARRLDRKAQRVQLDELVPRAEPGTRERQLEKKRELNDKMRSFRDKSPAGDVEVRDTELMGADEDGGVDGYKAQKKEQERKKNERELRREEMLRARREEREETMRVHRAKEDETMSMLKALAKQNFG